MTRERSLKGQLNTATILIAEGRIEEADKLLREIAADPGVALLGPETALGMPRRLHSARLKLAKARGDASEKIALQYHLVPPLERLEPLFVGSQSERRTRVAAAAGPVPEILHQIWIGGPPPETTEVWRKHAERQGWGYRLWTEDTLDALGATEHPVYRQMIRHGDIPGAVDVARYHVLRSEGGLYLDCDWMPVHDEGFDRVIPMMGLSAMAEVTPRLSGVGSPFLNNSVIAAPVRHPVFDMLLDTLPQVVDRLPGAPAWWATGPLVFTLACRLGPVGVLDAGLDGGQVSGTRADVMRRTEELRGAGSPAFLCGWKPWNS